MTIQLQDAQPDVARSPTQRVVNALTIDVEDYYHVSGFADTVSPDQWGAMESRVEESTQRILNVLGDAGVQGTFFVLGWLAERHPALVKAIQAAGHEIGCRSPAHLRSNAG
jgi:peptidoglycan/xylan/chitin deacetylase (PgdA/CDA1 family)